MSRHEDEVPEYSKPFPWAIVLAILALVVAGAIALLVAREHRQLRAESARYQLENVAWRDSITTMFERDAQATKAAYASTIDSLRTEVQKVRSTASVSLATANELHGELASVKETTVARLDQTEYQLAQQQQDLATARVEVNTLTASVDSLGAIQTETSTRFSGGLDQLRSDLTRRTPGKLTFGNAVRDALTITTAAILTTHIVGHPR